MHENPDCSSLDSQKGRSTQGTRKTSIGSLRKRWKTRNYDGPAQRQLSRFKCDLDDAGRFRKSDSLDEASNLAYSMICASEELV
jgi:hypothetical protein